MSETTIAPLSIPTTASGVDSDYLADADPAPTLRRREFLPDLLSIEELSVFVQIPKSTLYKWNADGEGPHPVKLGKHLRYRRSDVLEWLDKMAG
ncbi:hypothetical protein GCM10009808_06600 [Microbacterium sediminicola]|uniref:Helix-turn-helix domain-containing protein n=1 Tax=Microbacterium sediminicola TaxID=415210 RepID=A0ABP4TQU2_9MICO